MARSSTGERPICVPSIRLDIPFNWLRDYHFVDERPLSSASLFVIVLAVLCTFEDRTVLHP